MANSRIKFDLKTASCPLFCGDMSSIRIVWVMMIYLPEQIKDCLMFPDRSAEHDTSEGGKGTAVSHV